MSWSNADFHCINCGTILYEEERPNEELNKWDFNSNEEYQKYLISDEYKYSKCYYSDFGNSNTYHCTNEKCLCNEQNSIILFHPLRGIGSGAGDSLAFGCKYFNDKVFCFRCGTIIDINKMCCSNSKCFYSLIHCLDLIYDKKIKFAIGYIK